MTLKSGKLPLVLLGIIIISLLLLPSATLQEALQSSETRSEPASAKLRILLIPLDSRPPCLDFVKQLASVAGFTIIAPPEEMMARNKLAGDKDGLRLWLRENAARADAAIISIDSLVHGGLVPSRQGLGKVDDGYAVIELLKTVKRENPSLKIYGFNIIPRLIIADSAETSSFQNDMLQYAVLSDQIRIFSNELDQERKEKIMAKIPAALIEKYLRLYEENQQINAALLELVENDLLSGLVIGQDDGFSFGIANEKKQELRQKIMRNAKLRDRVVVTRGTDEVALTELAFICSREFNWRPHVKVVYSDESVRRMTMPFMPHSVATTVSEKLEISGAVEVDDQKDADYLLFVHAGRADFPDYEIAVERLNTLLFSGKAVAMVDLSESFKYEELLLPSLLRLKMPLSNLVSYAGWNTTSNSIGTAVTQANLLLFSEQQEKNIRLNRSFILARMIDDAYYQKQEHPLLNKRLRSKGMEPNALSSDEAAQLSAWLQKWAERKARKTIKGAAVLAENPADEIKASIPWNRTFEIKLEF